uniref:Uncharacterized protein n=1 Tax=Utricularia reniformis TaxID=192314 RepID=A0A1Y0AYY2_9LAMI|nr:hypothetical protein AEK19_MT1262 [Utricularia reniformis]ART30363.1 hypothetical protein AEK19_MT1262 [Utricularia reniformis]
MRAGKHIKEEPGALPYILFYIDCGTLFTMGSRQIIFSMRRSSYLPTLPQSLRVFSLPTSRHHLAGSLVHSCKSSDHSGFRIPIFFASW